MKSFTVNKRKYLDELGVDYSFGIKKNDKRTKKWKRFYKKYGFDSRETWGLDVATAWFVYERVSEFKNEASKVINLTFHKATVPVLNEFLEPIPEEMNVADAISYILTYIEKGLKMEEEDHISDWYVYIDCALSIYLEILPFLWW